MIQYDPMEENTSITKINDIVFLVGKVRGTQKQGKFYYFFMPQRALRFAGVYENDLKIGLWVDVIENYEFYSCGQYANGLKNGQWGIFSKDGMIGGGQYINGKKTGPWIDVEKSYSGPVSKWIRSQGQYENGIRKGEWRIYDKSQILYRYCGGNYNENGQKDGLWIEFEGWRQNKIFGKYKNGLPIGQWKYYNNGKLFGLFDDYGQKQGYWKDDEKTFGNYIDGKRVGYWQTEFGNGNYEDGLKTGEWTETENYQKAKGKYLRGLRIGEWEFGDNYHKGKGSYDLNGLKQGRWIVASPFYRLVLFQGDYKDDKPVGKWIAFQTKKVYLWKWKLFTRKINITENINIDDLEEEAKQKKYQKVEKYYQRKQKQDNNIPEEQIYLEIFEKGKRTEKWIYSELDSYIYSSNPLKVGRWVQQFDCEEKKQKYNLKSGVYIFEGSDKLYYLTEHNKSGYQIAKEVDLDDYLMENKTQNEISQGISKLKNYILRDNSVIKKKKLINFENLKSGDYKYKIDGNGKISLQNPDLILYGCYQQGFRIGKWIVKFRNLEKDYLIGGGYYENGFKNGYWIDPEDFYDIGREETYRGEYKDERRIGMWKIFYQNIEIGGGFYDENGFKQGEWIEPSYGFNFGKQFTKQGIYKDGRRIGQWKILFKRKKVGGGFYNEKGQKEGQWIDPVSHYPQTTFQNLNLHIINYNQGEIKHI